MKWTGTPNDIVHEIHCSSRCLTLDHVTDVRHKALISDPKFQSLFCRLYIFAEKLWLGRGSHVLSINLPQILLN